MISSAELIIYLNDEEDNLSISLSPSQLKGVIKLLGLQLSKNGDLSMYDDKSLNLIISKTLDRLKLSN